MGCRIKMETWEGKSFSITDPKGVNTVIYQINKTRKEELEDSPKYTIERLDYTVEHTLVRSIGIFYVSTDDPGGGVGWFRR